MDKVGIIKELEAHMEFMREGSTGRLLTDTYRLIQAQGDELATLKDQFKALTAHETVLIERLKIAEKPKRTRVKKK